MDIFDFVKEQTSIYDNATTWKKSVSLFNGMQANKLDTGVVVLRDCHDYFLRFVDVLAAQSQEKQKNYLIIHKINQLEK